MVGNRCTWQYWCNVNVHRDLSHSARKSQGIVGMGSPCDRRGSRDHVLMKQERFEWKCENMRFTDVEIMPTYHLLSSLILTVPSHTVGAMIIGGVARTSCICEIDMFDC